MRVLVTGGAGFIGRHLVDALLEAGHDVVVLDSLEPRVHPAKPSQLNPGAAYVWGDICERESVRKAGEGAEALFHLASLIEVAESEREIGRYVEVNVRGTAILLDTLLSEADSLDRLVLSSSIAVYGEGTYACPQCGPVESEGRTPKQLEGGEWEVRCPSCGSVLEPQATAEGAIPHPLSVYGLTKLVQERLFQAASQEKGIPSLILRFGNVFGPGQRGGAYAGVTTTFLRRIEQGKPPVVHEDGRQTRDFVAVHDVARACLAALEASVEGPWVANVGAGRPVSVLQLAEMVNEVTGSDLPPEMDGTFRPGDIRHLWLDTEKAKKRLGFVPSTGLEEGLREMMDGA